MEIADRIVAELGIEWFFNIQLVGEHVIEINPDLDRRRSGGPQSPLPRRQTGARRDLG